TVKNTKCSTTNWLKKFNDHCKEYVLDSNINVISDQKQLESNLVHFFFYAKCADKEEYSVNSVLSAIAAFQRYITEKSPLKGINLCDKQQFSTLNTLLNGKIKWLSTKGKGETKGSESLTLDECEHYFLKKDHFQKRQDEGYDIVIYKSKTNQHRIDNSEQADKISIPNLEHINNIYDKYFSKRFNDASPHFYLQAIDENSEAILTTSTATTTQATSATPTFQTAKKILQDSQLNNIESVTLSTESSHESFEKFNELSQETIYNNSN
ncbi:6420_t:CDS:2, partial [Cetraspora pellucida]